MNDRELLELAAKAAGYVNRGSASRLVSYMDHNNPSIIIANDRGGDSVWNPLTDDGDALRLAVKLGMNLVICDELGITDARVPSKTGWCTEQHWDASGAASRRAIVRAAAEIGKVMP